MPRWTPAERRFMTLALDLARKGQGRVEPNPMVGCVIVKNEQAVGRGYHRRFGAAHAEPNALKDAGRRARGATAYVSLEPCNHVGKTPPCADALIRAGILRAVVAMKDPNPLVAGKGIKALRAAGVQVDVGLMRKEAADLNGPFVVFHTRRRPYVILKWAQSIDGKIATRKGDSKWITSRASRAEAHAIRARVDAIVVGVNTVITDDPILTARHRKPKRCALRIVLDPNLRTPSLAKLVRTARKTPTMIVTRPPGDDRSAGRARGRGGSTAHMRKRRTLHRAGCELLDVPCGRSGINLHSLLQELRSRGMTNVMVEGGGRTLDAFLRRRLADEAQIFVAPMLIGGESAPGPLHGRGPDALKELPAVRLTGLRHFGPDLCYNMRFG